MFPVPIRASEVLYWSMRDKVSGGYLGGAVVKAAVHALAVSLVQGQRSNAAIVDGGGAVLG